MITIKSSGYWATGITVKYSPRGQYRDGANKPGWSASLDFLDDGFCDDDADTGSVSTQGSLQTRYFVSDGVTESGLGAAIDVLIGDANKLGIQFKNPRLYYSRDGEDKDYPPPVGWKKTLADQAERLGWKS